MRRMEESLPFRVMARWNWSRAKQAIIIRAMVETVQRMGPSTLPDLLEMEESFGMAWFVTRRIPIPLVVRLHGPWFLNGPASGAEGERGFRRRVRLEGRAMMEAAAVSAPCRYVLEQAERFYRTRLPHATVLPNAIAPPGPEKRWSISGTEPGTVLFVGRTDRLKGADTLIESFGEISRRLPGARLLLAGPVQAISDGSGRQVGLHEFIESRIAPEVRGRIAVLGHQHPERLMELRRNAAVTVVASRTENFPYSVLEAMAQGCPVVATRVGGIPEMLEPGKTGELVPPGDARALGEAVIGVLSNGERAAALGRRAFEEVCRRFAYGPVARQAIEFYRSVVDRRPR
jgi:glycosyltransferase involved in cell wall biosynthesis